MRLPLSDPSLPKHERPIVFRSWATAFYSHPCFRPGGSALAGKQAGLTEQEPKGADKIRPTTLEIYTPEERESNIDTEPGERSESLMLALPSERHRELASGTFLLSHPVYGGNSLPGVRVHFLLGEASVWCIHWFRWKLEEDMAKWEREGQGTRIGQFVFLPGANHFVSQHSLLTSDG